VALGHGLHRCVGEHLAKEIWASMLVEVLTRTPDLTLARDEAVPITERGLNNGSHSMPASFSPGPRRALSDAAAADVDRALRSVEAAGR